MNSVFGYTSGFPNVESIPMLNGSNFSEWKEHLLLQLALMDLDLSLRIERPSSSGKEVELWDRSNRVSVMIMRNRIPREFRGIIPENVTTAKEFLKRLENFYVRNEKVERSLAQAELSSLRYRENENVREFIMRMKTLWSFFPDESDDMMLASFAVKMLPSRYFRLQNVYRRLEENFAKENGCWGFGEIWSTSELISRCDMEEENLRREKRRREE